MSKPSSVTETKNVIWSPAGSGEVHKTTIERGDGGPPAVGWGTTPQEAEATASAINAEMDEAANRRSS